MNIFKLFSVLCLFWAVGIFNTAKAQFPVKLNALDSSSLVILRMNGFINATYTIPDSIRSFGDTASMRMQGIAIERVNGQFRVVDLYLQNRQTQPFDMANIASLFNADAFSQLRYLDLSNNQLFGSMGFNGGITVATAMHLMLNNNNLDSNSVTDFFMWFPNMEQLQMENGFDSTVLRLPSNMQHSTLKFMNFSRNGLLEIPATVFQGGFPIIETINFSRNEITALPTANTTVSLSSIVSATVPSLAAYSGFAKLKDLNLSHNQVSGDLPLDAILGMQLGQGIALRPLQALDFSHNNFDKVSDNLANILLSINTATLGSFFNSIYSVNVSSNALQFDDLFTVAISMGKRINTSASLDFSALSYANQDNIGVGGLRRRSVGRPLDFELPTRDNCFRNSDSLNLSQRQAWGAVRNSYTWVWGDSLAIATNNANQIYTIVRYNNQLAVGALSVTVPNGVAALDSQANYLQLRDSANNVVSPQVRLRADLLLQASYIYPTVSNHKFPALTLEGRKKKLSIGECYDTLGQVINCQEIAVQIDANATPAQLQEARDELGAIVIDQCVCGAVELWSISDAYRPDLEANGAGTRRASSQASIKPGLKSADNNYNLSNNVSPASDLTPSINIQGSRSATRTVVAIIDSGTDPDHPRLSPFIQYNTSENNNSNIDADANCEKGDIVGFNYVDKSNVPYDDHGHGTIVGSIIAGFGTNNIATSDTSIALLPIKYTNRSNYGSTFEASCAIYYAADHHINRNNGNHSADSVRVINASWGYTGEPCQVLKDAIEYAGTRCGILFVCSAGNESSNNELAGQSHYPSNYDLENVLAVTALNNDNQTLASYANYGSSKVDIATYGQFRNVLIPQSGSTVDSTALAQNGTSYATALVSRAAALLFNDYPEATFHAVKHALLHTATPLAGVDATKIVSGSLDISAARQYFAGSWDKTRCVEILGTNSLALPNAMSFISPNPTTTTLNLRLAQANAEAVQITIVDVKGVVVYQANRVADTEIEISTAELAQGLYILRLQTSRGVETHKFVKMNP